ncbi:Palmitoyltransferase pfa4 [Erysiphe neolycopersici]|uniref:Palmitoyltransferase PFA4 n=1 Tax=Erysiphe neolycopersici TaxID=212602 RepID=A0A420I3G4_9PEZI|nr:Palmitoyltransferase pfa4 [Erysiphe neolycopersici]
MSCLCKSFSVPSLSNLAIVVVVLLIIFLAYTPQFLFIHFEPGILSKAQKYWFNLLVFFTCWCYYKTCTVDAAPQGWVSRVFPNASKDGGKLAEEKMMVRWCNKCQYIKPPRAHHCKKCAKCVPKMDHHCPWISNCVSHLTFPHFIRFILYSVISTLILAYHLTIRLSVLWGKRNAPAYLGPPTWALLHLLVVVILNGVVLLSLSILLCRLIYGLVTNTTMIESWEIERHEELVHRCRKTGGYVCAVGGERILIEHQEFPYDIGVWKNLYQTMGTRNIFMWFMPFGGAPTIESAGNWEVNGFDDGDKFWPPLDPDKFKYHSRRQKDNGIKRDAERLDMSLIAFKARQNHDLKRRGHVRNPHVGSSLDDCRRSLSDCSYEEEIGIDGERGWTNSDGDRLRDFGVDEEEADLFKSKGKTT